MTNIYLIKILEENNFFNLLLTIGFDNKCQGIRFLAFKNVTAHQIKLRLLNLKMYCITIRYF